MRRAVLGAPFPLQLALRYLRSARRDAYTTFLSVVAAAGLALGVAALTVALAALSGLHTLLLGEVRERTPDLEVQLEGGAAAEALRREIGALPGVGAIGWRIDGRGWLLSEGRLRPVQVSGREDEAGAEPDAVRVGSHLAALWGLRAGDAVEIASSRPTLTPFGPQPRVRRLRVAAPLPVGRSEEEDRVEVSLEAAEALFGGAGRRLEMEVEDRRLAAVQAAVAARAPGAPQANWRDLHRGLLFALRLEKTVLFVAISLIALVASLALVADLSLMASNKQAELGILATLGATPRQLRRAFLCLGGLLAGAATLTGALIGAVTAVVLDRTELLRLEGQVYFVDSVPFLVRGGDLVAVILLALALALGGAWTIARRAAALDPVEALRR